MDGGTYIITVEGDSFTLRFPKGGVCSFSGIPSVFLTYLRQKAGDRATIHFETDDSPKKAEFNLVYQGLKAAWRAAQLSSQHRGSGLPDY